MTKKHLSIKVDERIWEFLKVKSVKDRKTMKRLVLEALEEKYDLDLGDKTDDKAGIGISDIDPSLVDVSKDLDGGKYGSKETVQEITLANIRYLRDRGKASKSDFMSDVYPQFKDDHKKDSYWKVSQSGFKQFADLTDKIKLASVGHSNYEWKG